MLNDREIVRKIEARCGSWYEGFGVGSPEETDTMMRIMRTFDLVLVRYARWLEKARWQELIDYGITYLSTHSGQVEYQDFDDEGC